MKKRTPTKKPKDVMDQRLNIVTLGVVDIKKARTFYQALGWTASSASKGNIVFFRAGGVVLALYPRELLAEDAQVSAEGSGFRGFTLAQNVRSKRQVAKVLTAAKAAGGKVLKRAQDVFLGRPQWIFFRPRRTYMGGGLESVLQPER